MSEDEFDDAEMPHPGSGRRHGGGGSSRHRPAGGGGSARDRPQRPRGPGIGGIGDVLPGFPFGLAGSEKLQIKLNKATPVEEILPFFEVDLSAP